MLSQQADIDAQFGRIVQHLLAQFGNGKMIKVPGDIYFVARASLRPGSPSNKGLVMIAKMISGGLFSEGAFDRLFQVLNSTMDRLFHGAFLMRHYDGLAAVAACLDHTAFVPMAPLMSGSVAKMHIDPPDAVTKAIQCRMDHCLHLSGGLLAAIDVSVCSDLDQHCPLRRYIAWKAVALFDAATLEEALVNRVLSYVRGFALLRRIYVRMLERLA